MAKRHPISAIFGDVPDSELAELAADIKANGLRVPVVLHEDMILDGWNRARACQMAGVKIHTRVFDPETEGDPIAYAISHNALRRQLTPEMRAASILRARALQPATVAGLTLAVIGKAAGVSTRTMERIAAAERGGLGGEVASGKLTPATAAAKLKPPVEKKPSKEEAEVVALRARVKDLEEKNADLVAELQSIVDVDADDKAQADKFKLLYRQIDGLESQVNEHMQAATMWQREALALRKKLGRR